LQFGGFVRIHVSKSVTDTRRKDPVALCASFVRDAMVDKGGEALGAAADGRQGQQPYLTQEQIQQKLEENAMLLEAINERQNVNSLKECAQLQAKLEGNLRELARLLEKTG